MSTYRIVIDRSLCSGYGTCAELAPELFEIGPDGVAAARQGTTDDPAVFDTAAGCPMGAIAVNEDASGERAA
jgi:ferredoxin